MKKTLSPNEELIKKLESYLRVLKRAHMEGIKLIVWSTDVELIERAVSALSEKEAKDD